MKQHSYFFFLQLVFLLFVGIWNINAQEQFVSRYNPTFVTMENGLHHNFIDDIYKDSKGFIWISTGGSGLSRYDGYEFIHFNISTSRTKLKSNFIRKVCEDDYGRLWIISDDGTNILDLSMYQTIDPKTLSIPLDNLLNCPNYNIIKDSKGNLWIAGNDFISHIVFDSNGNISDINNLSISPTTMPTAMEDIDNDGCVWAGIGTQVFKLFPGKNNLLEATQIMLPIELEAWTYISGFKWKENEIWIGTNNGLIRYNRNEELIKLYEHERNNNRSLTQNFISDLEVTAEKQLLIGTLKGINIYNPITDDFDHVVMDHESNQNYLNSNFINCIFADENIIWIGTESGGINKLSPRKLSVKSYVHNKDNPESLSGNLINSIYEDNNGNLWVGTVERGLNLKKNNEERFTHFTTDYPALLTHNTISAITADNNNRLWVGTWGLGLNLIDLSGDKQRVIKQISSYTHPDFLLNFVGALCYDSINNAVWIGSNSGIYFYDIQSDQLFSPIPDEINRNIHGSIGSVIDRHGQLWIGCMEGAYVINLNSRKNNLFEYTHLKYKLDDSESKLLERMSSFYVAKDGTLWLGSNGCGIYKHIPSADGNIGTFVAYTTNEGLVNNNVLGILEDKNGKLWISTNNGLSCFDPIAESFTNYTKEDGLLGNQFYWNAYSSSENGILYFGGVDGLIAIDPNRITPVELSSKVSLTRLSVMNEDVTPNGKHINSDISVAHTLNLHEKDKSFSLEFSALNYDPASTAEYRYRLLGFDKQWISVPASRRFASYTNLPAGKYTFQVQYLPEGIEAESPITELQIIVKPFFYKTPWFMFLLIAFVACIFIYFYFRRIHLLQQQKEKLRQKVEKRTHELEKQKLLLEKQTEELSLQNDQLIKQNEKITKQKQQLIDMSEKVQELTVDKLSFFTNITHEFRTPITLIIGPIERALKLSSNPKVIEQLSFVERNSKYLLSLINQLMDFRKVESGNMNINKRFGNFREFMESLILPFEAFAAERNITISKYFRIPLPEFSFDPDALQKVISNLLSNAVKFTHDGGMVSIYTSGFFDKKTGEEKLFISVKDNGVGILEEDVSKIFNRFYQSRNNIKFPVYGQSGTGIGLYLSQQIVNMYGGSMHARNNRKEGANFYLILPISRENTVIEANAKIPVSNEEEDKATSLFTPNKQTILVVEDNKDMRGFIYSILSENYNVYEAENGAEALSILTTQNVDFIISDLMMPVMDGVELSRKVRNNFTISHIPFLMLTARTDQESQIESYKTGVDGYLLKPFNEELLLARINNIIDNRKRYHQKFSLNMEADALEMGEESSDKKFINKAIEIIKANYHDSEFESSDFIESMGVSKSLLNKKLQTLIGQSIGQFIRNYRLNVARELIEKNKITRNLNISEIAYEVGFNDPKYFTRCFSKRYNMPPSSLMEEKD